MDYENIKNDFTQTWHKELFRRLRAIGYDIEIVNNDQIYANIYKGKDLIFQIDQNKDFKGDWRIEKQLLEETANYVFAHKAAPPIIAIVDGYEKTGFRKLLEFNDKILAAKLTKDKGYLFATGYKALTSFGQYVLKNCTDNYSEAKEDFSLKSGLIDKSKIFDEEEREIIYSSFKVINDLCINFKQPDVVRIINQVMAKLSESGTMGKG